MMIEHPAVRASQALEEFNQALQHKDALLGKKIPFNETVCVRAMDLFADLRGELEMHQFGEADRRDDLAEQMVMVVFRNEARRMNIS